MESNINKNTMITKLAFAMELYWLNQLKKQKLVSLDEYYKLKNDINNKYKQLKQLNKNNLKNISHSLIKVKYTN